MAKFIKSRNRGNYVVKFPNNKKMSFRTAIAFSNAMEVISKGRFINVAQMYDRVKNCPTGFEYVESERKSKELEKRFNSIELDE